MNASSIFEVDHCHCLFITVPEKKLYFVLAIIQPKNFS